ncbi:MAG: transposase [Thermoguttaceae bacterium]|nr:transposase [Thermoguttaceae bacterium]
MSGPRKIANRRRPLICRCRLPNAVRVFGRFHIAKMFNEGIDNVKRYHCAKIKNYRRKTRTQSNEIDSYEMAGEA